MQQYVAYVHVYMLRAIDGFALTTDNVALSLSVGNNHVDLCNSAAGITASERHWSIVARSVDGVANERSSNSEAR